VPDTLADEEGVPVLPDETASTASAPPNAPTLCPYCGHLGSDPTRCESCRGLFEPLSRQATQNAMGPWQLRDESRKFQPGFSFDTLRRLVSRGRINRHSIVRGPTTRQFWTYACNAPGVAVLLGECHSCHTRVEPDEYLCGKCGAALSPPQDRQTLGLSSVQLLPGDASPDAVAHSSLAAASAPAPATPATPQQRTATPTARQRPAHPPGTQLPAKATPPAQEQQSRQTTRRLRERLRFMSVLFVTTLGINIVLLAAVGVLFFAGELPFRFGFGIDGERDAQPATTQQEQQQESSIKPGPTPPAQRDDAAAPAPTVQPDEQPPVPIDPGTEQWSEDLTRAAILEGEGDVESLSTALRLLEGVLREARLETGDPTANYPHLEARLERIRDRIEYLELRELF
jgi:hypothetical protein